MADRSRHQEKPKKDWTKNLWVVLLDVSARVAGCLNQTKLANTLYLWASEVCIYDQDYYGAAFMAEKGGDIEGAIHHYINAGYSDKEYRIGFYRAKLLAARHGIDLPEHSRTKALL